MPRSSNQKLKLLYLQKILLEQTDENHLLSVKRIIELLEQWGVRAERKSVYDDIEALRTYGLDIEQVKGAGGGYYVASREFELPELKLLVDSVQSSRFITRKKSMELIKKIEGLACKSDAARLQRQVYVTNRIKTMNESIYYNVDEINEGIASNRKIRFRYFEYSVDKKQVFRKNGQWYEVSPFTLTWDDENYYMVAYDTDAGIIKHFRVDKMVSIEVGEEARDGKQAFEHTDPAAYSRGMFGMFSGGHERVTLRFADHLAGAVIDRFGKDAPMCAGTDGFFTVSADVVVSPRFLAWVFGFGGEAKILSPERVAEQMKAQLRDVCAQYGLSEPVQEA